MYCFKAETSLGPRGPDLRKFESSNNNILILMSSGVTVISPSVPICFGFQMGSHRVPGLFRWKARKSLVFSVPEVMSYQYCDIPLCCNILSLLGTHEDEPLQLLAHHVVHIGIDGLRPDCIFDAPGGALNFKKRMLEKVY